MHSVEMIKDNLLKEVKSLKLGHKVNENSLVIPCINEWTFETNGDKLCVIGKVKFHGRFADGSGIKTTPIQNHRIFQNRLIVMTQKSIYELGQPSASQLRNESLGIQNLSSKLYSPVPDPWSVSDEETQHFTLLSSDS